MTQQQSQLIAAAIEYDRGDARRIQHFMKVYGFATTIATLEQLDSQTTFILETAAILHDIGIHEAEHKYGKCSGPYQEKEGPAVAREIMMSISGYNQETIERVEWLIAHHHHVNDIHDIDHQILVEADYLVNIYEDELSASAIDNVRTKVFRTNAGLKLLNAMYPQSTTTIAL
jgi:uncharacterized protein